MDPTYGKNTAWRRGDGQNRQGCKARTPGRLGCLPERREPHWRSISEGLAIGYRKGAKGGTWIARHYTPEIGRRFNSLGTADDVADADGVHVLNFGQAQEAARAWFGALARQDRNQTIAGPYTVGQALDDYVADYKRRGGKAADRLEAALGAHIRPELGEISVRDLTRQRIEKWHAKLAETPPASAPRPASASSTPPSICRPRLHGAAGLRQTGC